MFWPFTVWGFLKPNFEPHEYWLSRTRCCNSTYRLRYWNFHFCFLLLLNTKMGCNSTYRLRYWNRNEIFYHWNHHSSCNSTYRLRYWNLIETWSNRSWPIYPGCNSTYRLRYWNVSSLINNNQLCIQVATVLTVYGIET